MMEASVKRMGTNGRLRVLLGEHQTPGKANEGA